MTKTFQQRLLQAIPGGAHTYSRGYDQFPLNAPEILIRGNGAYVYDHKNTEILDYGMALRAVTLGYAHEAINNAAMEQINNGNNLTRPSLIELEAAELLIDLIDSVEMVKFAKNGSTATTAAIKLARAYTGLEMVIRCEDHPFFSYDDWFIASTAITKGIPQRALGDIKTFKYNDISSLEKIVAENSGKIACLIMEPCTSVAPCGSKYHPGKNFLHDVESLCKKNNIIFILDEMITGFRWHLKGAQHVYKLSPDLCTFGKAMSNGFSVAAVAGRREIMQLGSIEFKDQERVFLLSSTHGAEMCGLGGFKATVEFIRQNKVIEHIWDYGKEFIEGFNKLSQENGIRNHLFASGFDCSPIFTTFDQNEKPSMVFRTLFLQEMMKSNVLIPWVALSFAHGKKELEITLNALDKTMKIYKKALNGDVDEFVKGQIVKPVFRKYN